MLPACRRHRVGAPVLAMGILWSVAGLAGGASGREPVRLTSGGPPRRVLLAGGGVDRYRIALSAGDFLDVTVRQLGLDVAVALRTPSGDRWEIDTPTGTRGYERLSTIADRGGEFDVEVRSLDAQDDGGFYEISIAPIRASTDRDRQWVSAQTAFAKAYAMRNEQTAAARDESLVLYRQALSVWQERGDRFLAAMALHSIADVLDAREESENSLTCFEDALSLRRSVGDAWGEAYTLTNMALMEYELGRVPEGLQRLRAALEITRALDDRRLESEALTNLGKFHDSMGDKAAAMASYDAALVLTRRTRNLDGEVRTLNRLGMLHESRGDKQKALDYFRSAVDKNRTLGNRVYDAVISGNVARVLADLGEASKAIAYFHRSLAATRAIGDKHSEGALLLDLGHAHEQAGDAAQARSLYGLALPLLRAAEDPRAESAALVDLAQLDAEEGCLEESISHLERALVLARSTSDPYRSADALTALGASFRLSGRRDESAEAFRQALDLRAGASDRIGEAWTNYEFAALLRDLGRAGEARSRLENAIQAVEHLRGTLASNSARASYLGRTHRYYDAYIDLLLSSSDSSPDVELALQTSERARARALLDFLDDVSSEPPSGSLEEKERSLRGRLEAIVRRRLSGTSNETEVARELESVTLQLEELERTDSGDEREDRSLGRTAFPTVGEMRSRLLDPDTVLLEYWLGRERSLVWAMSSRGTSVHVLPAREILEEKVRKLTEALSVSPGERGAGGNAADSLARELGETLLGPLREELSARRVVVVADGILHFLPFGVLVPAGSRSRLIDRFEVVTIPSAVVMASSRRRRTVSASNGLAIFADPVFERSDPRVHVRVPVGVAGLRSDKPGSPEVARASTQRGAFESPGAISRLPFTRREALALLRLFPSSESRPALDFDASVDSATSREIGRYRYLHFATHAVFDAVHPELSGILLSMVDRNGRSREGFLPVSAVYRLRLSADLVVLSACRTALGYEIRGEGMIGLTRAFMYAGVPRVVASLWRVDDAATAELMTRFYEGMLGSEKLSPAAALRRAQLSVGATKRWADPYFWGGFVLQGEWR